MCANMKTASVSYDGICLHRQQLLSAQSMYMDLAD